MKVRGPGSSGNGVAPDVMDAVSAPVGPEPPCSQRLTRTATSFVRRAVAGGPDARTTSFLRAARRADRRCRRCRPLPPMPGPRGIPRSRGGRRYLAADPRCSPRRALVLPSSFWVASRASVLPWCCRRSTRHGFRHPYDITAEQPTAFLREDRTLTTQVVLLQSQAVLAPVANAFGMPLRDLEAEGHCAGRQHQRDAPGVEVRDESRDKALSDRRSRDRPLFALTADTMRRACGAYLPERTRVRAHRPGGTPGRCTDSLRADALGAREQSPWTSSTRSTSAPLPAQRNRSCSPPLPLRPGFPPAALVQRPYRRPDGPRSPPLRRTQARRLLRRRAVPVSVVTVSSLRGPRTEMAPSARQLAGRTRLGARRPSRRDRLSAG